MSKGLEALEMLKNRALSDLDSIPKTAIPICEKSNEEVMKAYETLKQSLFELKQIKEAEPSEALKCIDVLKEEGCITTLVQGKILETIRQYILKAQEQEKILSIILKKRIDLESFYSTFVKDDLDYKYYEKYYGTYGLELLTQEEFDLIKEVLKK